ncbi:MAG: transposase [Thermoplasmata archaeon]|nr:transposase [Thermoplasmata archaeon]
MFLTYACRLYPLRPQLAILAHHLFELTFLWNFSLAPRRDAWQKEHRRVTYLDQQAHLKEWREFDSEGLGLLSYDVARDGLQRLDLACRAFFRRIAAGERPGFPHFRRETQSFTFIPGGSPIVPGTGSTWRLKVPIVGELPIRLHRPPPVGGIPKSVTVRLDAGAWFATIVFAIPDPPPPSLSAPAHPVGVDLGLTALATLSSGERIEAPEPLHATERKLRFEQRRLARKKRGSRRYARQREKVARCHARLRRQRRWHAHQISRDLATRFDLVAFEDLDAAELREGCRFAKSMTEAGWGLLRQLTAYKAALRSGRCVRVASAGTTQVCSHCRRWANPPMELGDRSYSCPCGLTMDRDENAARNILERGLTLLD